jgi:signal transduction histidine kinase/DNA-binding response OmpR family regulator
MDKVAGISGTSDGEDHARDLSNPTQQSGVDYPALFEASPDVLLVLLPDAPRFTMVAATNARFHATHTTRESLGRGLFEVFPDNPDDPAATGTSNLRASLERVLKTGQPDTMPVQKYDIRGEDGAFETKYWSPKNIPVLSPQGHVRYLLHRVEDVTELVRASELGEELRGRTHAMEREVIGRSHELAVAMRSLRETNLKLAELDTAKTVFFNSISQEFRTPLALILGTLENEISSHNKALPAQTRSQLKVAHRSSLRLLKLVNSLLDFSSIEAGRMHAHYQPTDLAVLTAELASNFHSAVEKGGLVLTVDCPPLPEPIYVDRAMWEKIVVNLISNAFKHTFQGSITVRLSWLDDSVQLVVADTGVGIAADDIPRLFDRFHRIEGNTSRTHEGTGIGLSLVKELVKLHSGLIVAESEPGRGSRFTVTLKSGTAHLPAENVGTNPDTFAPGKLSAPYIEEALQWVPTAAPAGEVDQTPVTGAGGALARPTWAAPRARILWADDNADMRAFVARLLGTFYDVTAVPDGQAALEAALASPPDLVLSDVMMPRLDGFGLLRALRADSRTRRLPIILVSARAGEELTVAGLNTGADDYLIKPFSARELLARVRTHVELAWQRRAWESELEQRVKKRTTELETQIQRMSLLNQISRAVAERQELRGIFQVVIRSVEENLPADVCWIGLPGAATAGFELGNGLVYEPDIQSGSIQLPQELAALELRAVVAAPLRAQGDLLGVLLAGRRQPDSFSSGECEFLRQLSEHVAIAARQGQLDESLQAAYDDLHLTQQALVPQERRAPAASAEPAEEPAPGESKLSTR